MVLQYKSFPTGTVWESRRDALARRNDSKGGIELTSRLGVELLHSHADVLFQEISQESNDGDGKTYYIRCMCQPLCISMLSSITFYTQLTSTSPKVYHTTKICQVPLGPSA